MHLDKQHSYWAKAHFQTDQNWFYKVLHNPEHVLHQLLQPVPASIHSYVHRTRRITDKWRTLLSIETLSLWNSLHA